MYKTIKLTEKQFEVLSQMVHKIRTGDGGNRDYSDLHCPFSAKSHDILWNIDKKFQDIKNKKKSSHE